MGSRLIIIVIIIALIGGFFLFAQKSSNDLENEGLNDISDTESLGVPTPGSEGVDEMIMNDDNDNDDEFNLNDVEVYEAPTFKLVEYTNDGFVPKEIEIELGDTVRFLNSSNRSMWISSDNHPTHTLYPEKTEFDCLGSSFDQCKATNNGEFWDFTFNTNGTHGYHNHSRANHLGKVIVK
jgi:plastocyanin